jgi:hypothetical protein
MKPLGTRALMMVMGLSSTRLFIRICMYLQMRLHARTCLQADHPSIATEINQAPALALGPSGPILPPSPRPCASQNMPEVSGIS